MVTLNRNPLFSDVHLAIRLAGILHGSCILKDFSLLAHAILPDHVHFLVWKDFERGLENPRSKMGVGSPAHRERSISFESGLSSPRAKRMVTDAIESRVYFRSVLSRARRERSHQVNSTISQLVQSIKGTFSRSVHQGRIWQPRFYSTIVAHPTQYHHVLRYIVFNHQKHLAPKKFEKPPYVFVGERIPD